MRNGRKRSIRATCLRGAAGRVLVRRSPAIAEPLGCGRGRHCRHRPPPPQPRPPPRAAQVLEGLEKAERNLLPILNNLLENREMAVRATLLLLCMP